LLALLFAGVLGTGCAYRATLQTNPIGAAVFIDGEAAGIAPVLITVTGLWRKPQVLVELPGYRSYEIDLATESRPWPRIVFAWTHPLVVLGKRPPPTRIMMLIPEHGPAGTWTPEDVER
jgi:hypothetical protein